MSSDDKKIKTDPANKNDVPSKDKNTVVDTSKAEGGKIADAVPYSRGEGQKPVSQAYRDNWNAIFARKAALLPAQSNHRSSPDSACRRHPSRWPVIRRGARSSAVMASIEQWEGRTAGLPLALRPPWGSAELMSAYACQHTTEETRSIVLLLHR